MINQLKVNFVKDQNRMKVQADKNRSERVFQVGDSVWLKLQRFDVVETTTLETDVCAS